MEAFAWTKPESAPEGHVRTGELMRGPGCGQH